jgi:hypothetical protein
VYLPQGRVSRVDPVPGTEFAVAYLAVNPTVSGLAVGSMVAGAGSALVALVVICFGVAGAGAGWGPLVAGAFAILAGLVGGGAMFAGLAGLRQMRRAQGQLGGRGLALTGVATGGSGLGVAALAVVLAVLLR